ncbi:MAG: CHAP domain-containing protein [Candidatus Howiella sp.]
MKKRFVCLITVMAVFMGMAVTPFSASAASNPYPYQHNITGRWIVNCTWYAWQQAYERTGVALPAWGNAGQWYNNAAAQGWSVGTTAAVNSIAVWTDGSYGHVGYVVGVEGEYISVIEGGRSDTTDGIGSIKVSVYAKRNYGTQSLQGFIYLAGSPTPAQDPWTEVWSPSEIGETDARINGYIRNPSGVYISTVGCSVWDGNGNLLATHYEAMSSGYHTYDGVKMWFYMNRDCGLTLQKGKTYRYQMFVICSDNRAFYTDVFQFRAAGSRLGDVNEDGSVTVSDVVELRKQIISGSGSSDLSSLGDMDQNNSLTVSDVVALRNYIISGVA